MVALLPSAKSVKPADGDHQVEQRHALAIGERLRLRRFPDDADLLGIGADESAHDHGDDRIPDILGQHLLDVARQGRRILAERGQVLEERRRDLSVGSNRDRLVESSGFRQTVTLTLSSGPIL